MTKLLVATVVLQLVAEARLSLQDPLVRWLPGLLSYGDHVTIRQLLNHTGGVPDHAAIVSGTLDGFRQGRFRAWAPQKLVALVADQPPSFPPGTSWSYSNIGYVLLGLTVEATGSVRSFTGASSAHLGCTTAASRSTPWASRARCRAATAWPSARLLPPRLLAEMLTAVPVPPGSLPVPLYDRYGLGLVVLQTPVGRLVGHPGGIPGFSTIVLSTPDGRQQLGIMPMLASVPRIRSPRRSCKATECSACGS